MKLFKTREDGNNVYIEASDEFSGLTNGSNVLIGDDVLKIFDLDNDVDFIRCNGFRGSDFRWLWDDIGSDGLRLKNNIYTSESMDSADLCFHASIGTEKIRWFYDMPFSQGISFSVGFRIELQKMSIKEWNDYKDKLVKVLTLIKNDLKLIIKKKRLDEESKKHFKMDDFDF